MADPTENPRYSEQHPHEPNIPPALDEEGRCRICVMLVELARLREERDKLRELLTRALPVLGGNGRGFSQEILILACELLGSDPDHWSAHPGVLAQRRATLASVSPGQETACNEERHVLDSEGNCECGLFESGLDPRASSASPRKQDEK